MYNGYTNIYGNEEAILTNSTHICMCVCVYLCVYKCVYVYVCV